MSLSDTLRHLETTGFRDLAGARVTAAVPISERLVNELVAASLPPNLPVRDVSIRPEANNQLSVRIMPRTGWLPPMTVTLEIVQQPDFPRSPVLALQMKTKGGLLGLASTMLPIANMLPPGVRLEDKRILVDLHEIAAQRGFDHLLQHLTRLTVTSESGRIVLHLEAGA